MRIVCDTNVLVRAAIHPSGLAGELLKLIRASHLLVASLPLLAEVLQVLRRPKIQALHGLDEHGIRRFVTALYKAALIVQVPHPIPRVVPHDPKDDAILLTAIGGKAERLATRDQHLFHPDVLKIGASYRVRIITDDALLEELRADRP
jgi:putative PIN family toxin of toxin-antitoxin system